MPETVILQVLMHCEGCTKAVKRACARIPGVATYRVDYPAQKVTVTGDVTSDVVLKCVLKAGKHAELVPKTEQPAKKEDNLKEQVKKEGTKPESKKAEPPNEDPYPITFLVGRDFINKYYYY